MKLTQDERDELTARIKDYAEALSNMDWQNDQGTGSGPRRAVEAHAVAKVNLEHYIRTL